MKIRRFLQNYILLFLAGNRLFRIAGETGLRSGIFWLKPLCDQDGANKKVQPNQSSRSGVIKVETYTQTDKNPNYFVVLISIIFVSNYY